MHLVLPSPKSKHATLASSTLLAPHSSAHSKHSLQPTNPLPDRPPPPPPPPPNLPKMTLTIPDEVRAKAEIYLGDAAGQEKTRLLLQETGLPSGLLPLRDIIECGYVEETKFVWLKQRRKEDHYFAKAGRHVTYGAEVSAYADKGKLKKITGVKAKEMLIWVALNEICVDDPPQGKLHCKALGGLSRSFPVEAFEAEDAGRVIPRWGIGCEGGAPAAAAVANGNGNGEAGVDAEKKKEEEEAKKDAPAAAEEGSKDLSTGDQAVHANGEAVAAKN